jgi:hypothetical protein
MGGGDSKLGRANALALQGDFLPPGVTGAPSALYPPPDKPRLRIALLFGAGGLQPQSLPLLRLLAACEAATIALLVRHAPVERHAQGWAFGLYGLLDGHLEKRHLPSLDAPFDPATDCPLARIIDCSVLATGGGSGIELPAPALAALRDADLHVIIALDRSDWQGAVLSASRYGLWQYDWNGEGSERLDAALAEVLSNDRGVVACGLRQRTAQDKVGGVIARAEVTGVRLSLAIARRRVYEAAAVLAPRALRRLQRGEPLSTKPLIEPQRRSAATLTNGAIMRLMPRLALRWLWLRLSGQPGGWWFLAVRLRRDPTQETPATAGFRPLPAERGHYYADPFLIEKDGATHLFFEDFDVKRGRARIAHAALAADGTPSRATSVLERPYHISYPFVFSWRGDTWLLPETGGNRSVELYRCEEFPQRWGLDRTLLTGWRMVDATLHEDDGGGWWMFVQVHEHPRDAGALFLFMAETPLGPWQPHPSNPIQSDIRYARPGGRLFRHDGRLLRPAQDCSQRYGGALWLMEVRELTAELYREEPFLRLDPLELPGNLCLHHRDATDGFEFVDGMRLHPPAAAR